MRRVMKKFFKRERDLMVLLGMMKVTEK